MDFSETIAASDLKVSWSRHLIEYMKIYMRSPERKPAQSPEMKQATSPERIPALNIEKPVQSN